MPEEQKIITKTYGSRYLIRCTTPCCLEKWEIRGWCGYPQRIMDNFKKKFPRQKFNARVNNFEFDVIDKASGEVVCHAMREHEMPWRLEISDTRGKRLLGGLYYIKGMSDFDIFDEATLEVMDDFVPTGDIPQNERKLRRWKCVWKRPEKPALACFDGNNMLYFFLDDFSVAPRYEMVTEEIILMTRARLWPEDYFPMLERWDKEGRKKDIDRFLGDFGVKNVYEAGVSPQTNVEWQQWLSMRVMLMQKYPDYTLDCINTDLNCAFVEKNSKKGVILAHNEEFILPCEYEVIADDDGRLAGYADYLNVKKNGLWGRVSTEFVHQIHHKGDIDKYINRVDWLCEPRYESISELENFLQQRENEKKAALDKLIERTQKNHLIKGPKIEAANIDECIAQETAWLEQNYPAYRFIGHCTREEEKRADGKTRWQGMAKAIKSRHERIIIVFDISNPQK
jgi:hypothetical protein